MPTQVSLSYIRNCDQEMASRIGRCCVRGCKSTTENFRLYYIPKNERLRKLWLQRLVRNDPSISCVQKRRLLTMRVCEKHFERKYIKPEGKRLYFGYPTLITESEISQGVPLDKPHGDPSSACVSPLQDIGLSQGSPPHTVLRLSHSDRPGIVLQVICPPDRGASNASLSEPSKMEAVVFDGSKMTINYFKDFPIPKIVNDGDVIVKVAYSGVCGTDVHIIQGEFPALKERPFPLGHEFSGVVAEVGNKSIFMKGQRVVVDPNRSCNLCNDCRKGNYQYCSVPGYKRNIGVFSEGGWAQYVRVPQDQVFLLPDEVTLEQGGLCEPYSCVAHGYDRVSPLKVGEKILIVGAGIIGNIWVTILHYQGHRDVTVSESNKTRLDTVNKLKTGYRLVTPDVLEKGKPQFDVIIDCTGVGKVMETSLNYIKAGGKYVIFGCAPPTHRASVVPFDIFDKELTIIGVKVNPFSFPSAISWLKAMGDRYLNYERLGVKIYSLSEYKNALDDLKRGSVSKAVFKIE